MFATSVEFQFYHLPTTPPDVLHESACSRNGVLLWLTGGEAAHAIWDPQHLVFSRASDGLCIPMNAIRAWATVPFPVSPTEVHIAPVHATRHSSFRRPG